MQMFFILAAVSSIAQADFFFSGEERHPYQDPTLVRQCGKGYAQFAHDVQEELAPNFGSVSERLMFLVSDRLTKRIIVEDPELKKRLKKFRGRSVLITFRREFDGKLMPCLLNGEPVPPPPPR